MTELDHFSRNILADISFFIILICKMFSKIN